MESTTRNAQSLVLRISTPYRVIKYQRSPTNRGGANNGNTMDFSSTDNNHHHHTNNEEEATTLSSHFDHHSETTCNKTRRSKSTNKSKRIYRPFYVNPFDIMLYREKLQQLEVENEKRRNHSNDGDNVMTKHHESHHQMDELQHMSPILSSQTNNGHKSSRTPHRKKIRIRHVRVLDEFESDDDSDASKRNHRENDPAMDNTLSSHDLFPAYRNRRIQTPSRFPTFWDDNDMFLSPESSDNDIEEDNDNKGESTAENTVNDVHSTNSNHNNGNTSGDNNNHNHNHNSSSCSNDTSFDSRNQLIETYGCIDACEQCNSHNCSHMKMMRRYWIHTLIDRASQYVSMLDFNRAIDDYHSILLIAASQINWEVDQKQTKHTANITGRLDDHSGSPNSSNSSGDSSEYHTKLLKIADTSMYWALHYCLHSCNVTKFQTTCELYSDIFPDKLDYLLEYTKKLIDGENTYIRDVVVQCSKILLETVERLHSHESVDIHSQICGNLLNYIRQKRRASSNSRLKNGNENSSGNGSFISQSSNTSFNSDCSTNGSQYSKQLAVEHSEQLLEIHKSLADYEGVLATVSDLIEKQPNNLRYYLERAECYMLLYDVNDDATRDYCTLAREDCLHVMLCEECDSTNHLVAQAEGLLMELNTMRKCARNYRGSTRQQL